MVAEKEDTFAAAESAREDSFLDLAPPLPVGLPDPLLDRAGRPFGPLLCKLTPWRHHLLLGYSSPFVRVPALAAATCTPAQLLQALYLCSRVFVPGSPFRFFLFRLRWSRLVRRRRLALAEAFTTWLDAPFRLMPPMEVASKDGAGRPSADVHWLAGWVNTGRSLGFSEQEVLHLPYVRLWQYVDIVLSRDPDRPKFDRKLARKRGEYLRRKKAAAAP